MRRLALLPLLWCVSGGVQAAPAPDDAVGRVLAALGVGSLGASLASLVIDTTPALKALAPADQACAKGPVRDVLDAGFRRSIIQDLGGDGDAVIAEWARFLPTPAGMALSRTFADSTPDNTEARAAAGLSDADRAKLAAFIDGAAYRRMVASFKSASGPPDDLGAQLFRPLRDQCRIVLEPGQIS